MAAVQAFLKHGTGDYSLDQQKKIQEYQVQVMKRHKKLKMCDIFSESGVDFTENEKKFYSGAILMFHLLQITGDKYPQKM